jgi:spore germination protein GerM
LQIQDDAASLAFYGLWEQNMNRRFGSPLGLLVISFALVVAGSVGWWLARPDVQSQPMQEEEQPAQLPASAKRVVHLYFADENGRYLMAEQRIIRQPADRIAMVYQLVDALIKGPHDGGGRTLPNTTELQSAFILNDGRAVLDFSAASFEDLPGGVGTELLAVYSIVNTLVLNIDSLRSIKIIMGGHETQTLAGHVAIGQAFEANMLWVR